MAPGTFWSRFRRARLVRVLLVYAAASWLVLQVTSLLRQELQLPAWVSPVALLLLLIGLVIISATAWVQAHPLGHERIEREEIPGAWEIDLADVRESVSQGRLPHLTWSRAILGGVVAFWLLFGLAGLYVLLRDDGRILSPTVAQAGVAPGVAVLPFSVNGPGLEQWREGLVDLLSTNLDGVAGLRTIDSRTVLATWRGKGSADLTLREALDVARAAGARYALIGSAVSSGPDLRLVADVYDIESLQKLGQSQTEGTPDSIFSLVDRFSIEVLRTLLQKHSGELPRLSLASVTTSSVAALKSYLKGERAYRRSDFRTAAEHYRRAVEMDSTFALAWHRFGTVTGWLSGFVADSAVAPLRRAARLADRLPERERLLLIGEIAYWRGTLDGIEPLQRAVRAYPDDAEAWYLLGENYMHNGSALLEEIGAVVRALTTAVERDPGFAPAYVHLMEAAFLNPDSALAARLVNEYAGIAPASDPHRWSRVALPLAFGDSATRSAARAALDTIPTQTLALMAVGYLWNPRFMPLHQEVLNIVRRRPDPPEFTIGSLFSGYLLSGKLRAAVELLDDPHRPAWLPAIVYVAHRVGLPVPESNLASLLSPGPPDSAFPDRDFFVGAFAADEGRWNDHARSTTRLREHGQRFLAEGDSAHAHSWEAMALALEGYSNWKRDRKEEALVALERSRTQVQANLAPNFMIRWWLGELAMELGRWRDSERYLRSFWFEPLSSFHLGRIYEELGEHEKARKSYEFFADAWREADPELQPMVKEARAAAQRLAKLARE